MCRDASTPAPGPPPSREAQLPLRRRRPIGDVIARRPSRPRLALPSTSDAPGDERRHHERRPRGRARGRPTPGVDLTQDPHSDVPPRGDPPLQGSPPMPPYALCRWHSPSPPARRRTRSSPLRGLTERANQRSRRASNLFHRAAHSGRAASPLPCREPLRSSPHQGAERLREEMRLQERRALGRCGLEMRQLRVEAHVRDIR